jgi:hypothetical protein
MAKKRQQKPACPHSLRELIAEAIIDCYGNDEQHAGLVSAVQEYVACPFHAKVIGETVDVIDLEPADQGHGLNAVCRYKGREYAIDVGSMEWVEPYPAGYEWIEAYLAWRQGIE